MRLSSLPTLTAWAVVLQPPTDPFKAPELGSQHLNGIVSGHPSFEDGKHVTTTSIRCKDTIEGEDVVVTYSGTRYRLGTVHEDYENLYPNARARLFNSLTLLEEKA